MEGHLKLCMFHFSIITSWIRVYIFHFFTPYFFPPPPWGLGQKNELLMGCWKEMMKKEKGGMCEGIGFLFFNLNDLKLFIRNIYSSFNSSLFSWSWGSTEKKQYLRNYHIYINLLRIIYIQYIFWNKLLSSYYF